MFGPNLRTAASRSVGFVAQQRPFSTTIPARASQKMEDLLLEIPPELRIGGVSEKKPSKYPVASISAVQNQPLMPQ